MLIISDLHLGNPFCKGKDNVVKFIHWAAEQGYDLAINGDGLEIAQASFRKIATDVPEVFNALRSAGKNKCKIYYLVGNHDIALENFLADWGNIFVTPFLNCWSNGKLIRIEHGHLYDPFFVKNPELYEFMTWFAGLFLKIHPSLYKLWIRFEKLKSQIRSRKNKSIIGESEHFTRAAQELTQRGFDHVVFGHTHHVGKVDLGGGKSYLNPGSWMMGTHFVEISNGEASLKNWRPS